MRVRLQGFLAAFVFYVPSADGFVVGRGEEEVAPGVHRQAPHPVVVPHEGEEAQAHTHIPHLLGGRLG